VSPPMKLCAFGLLLVAIFLAARAAGSSLGPVTTTYSRGGTSVHTGPGMPGMNMFGSSTPAPARSATPPAKKEQR
jgi:hypothetical protein